MEFEEVRPFLEANHRGVVTTVRPRCGIGAVQASVVVCGPYQGHVKRSTRWYDGGPGRDLS